MRARAESGVSEAARLGTLVAMRRPSLLGLIYLGVGVAVAASYGYLETLRTVRQIVSALLAILLWPLLLLGIDLHIRP